MPLSRRGKPKISVEGLKVTDPGQPPGAWNLQKVGGSRLRSERASVGSSFVLQLE